MVKKKVRNGNHPGGVRAGRPAVIVDETEQLPQGFSTETLPRSPDGVPISPAPRRGYVPRGSFADVCEELCGGRAENCPINPSQCPRAQDGSVDID